jgi:hypothetical protein
MIQAQFRPISQWSKPVTKYRESSRFRKKYAAVLDLLETELNAVSARDIVIQIDLGSADIRNDGWPRSNARPTTPRVRLSFEIRLGGVWKPINFEADLYHTWEENLQAIAATLEAQRAIRRWGTASVEQQFTGYAALPPPAGHVPEQMEMTPTQAANVIAKYSGFHQGTILADRQACLSAFRKAAAATHPDNQATGNAEASRQVLAAKRVLDKHHTERG